ncbi:hypothetical protein JB92DRAFT_2833130 [Gautieria morchelliformis]|nr:hypothetical protein JB92DRAFT_2833130 [Gautieria morchelliformis]
MPFPCIQEPDDDDEVQPLLLKSIHLGRMLKPSALLKDPDNVANIPVPEKHTMVVTTVVDYDQHKKKRKKPIAEPSLVSEPNVRPTAKPAEPGTSSIQEKINN